MAEFSNAENNSTHVRSRPRGHWKSAQNDRLLVRGLNPRHSSRFAYGFSSCFRSCLGSTGSSASWPATTTPKRSSFLLLRFGASDIPSCHRRLSIGRSLCHARRGSYREILVTAGPVRWRLYGVIRGHGISLLRWRSGGVTHPHDMRPFRFPPSPTFSNSSGVRALT
jgi:hypothetical protein